MATVADDALNAAHSALIEAYRRGYSDRSKEQDLDVGHALDLFADLAALITQTRAAGARDALNAAADEAMKFAVFADAAAWLRERAVQHEEVDRG